MSKPNLADVELQLKRAAQPAATGIAPTSPYYRPGRAKRRAVTVFWPDVVRDQLRLMGVERRMTVQAQMTEALNDYFAKHRKPEIAE